MTALGQVEGSRVNGSLGQKKSSLGVWRNNGLVLLSTPVGIPEGKLEKFYRKKNA